MERDLKDRNLHTGEDNLKLTIPELSASEKKLKEENQRLNDELKSYKESEERFRTFVENANDILYQLSPEGVFTYASPNWTEVLGYGFDEVVGERIDKFVHQDDLNLCIDFLDKVLSTGKKQRGVEYRVKHKNGTWQWHSSNGAPIKDVNGKIVSYIGIARDITENLKTDDKIRTSERRFRALIENATDGVSIVSTDGRIVYASPNALRIFGYTEEDLSKQLLGSGLTHPDDLIMVEETLSKVAQNPEYRPVLEYRFKKKDGEYIWIENTFANMLNDPVIKGFVLNFRDITEKKKAEQELVKFEKLKSVGTLAGGIAHDFNNILAVIYGNISFLKMDLDENHENYSILAEIENSINRAKKLSNQLLTFSKGGSPVKKEVNITDLLKETISFDLSGSHLKPVFSIKESYFAQVDEGQMQQVFSNIAINSIQSSPEGTNLYVSLISCFVSDNEVINLKSGKYLKVTIRDKGCGIATENLARIFDPYFTTKKRGNGLGLATVYSIIQKHGGAVIVDSEWGKGSTFTVYLPESESNKIKSVKTLIKKEAGRIEKTDSKRVLIMDDEEAICSILSRFMGKLGYDSDIVFDGEQAIGKYRESIEKNDPFDLIIMDLTIPGGMGGKEALNKVLEINKGAKVIVSSGYSDEVSIAGYKTLGFTDVLEKPYTMSELKKLLDKIF